MQEASSVLICMPIGLNSQYCYSGAVNHSQDLGPDNDRKETRSQNQKYRQGFTGATAQAVRRHGTSKWVRLAFWNRAEAQLRRQKFPLRILPLPRNMLIQER